MAREAKYKDFGDRLKQARLDAGMSGPQVAEALGVSPQAYHQWEAGLTTPKGADRQKMVAETLGKTVNELFFNEPAPAPLLRPIAVWENEVELGGDYIFLPALEVKLSAGDGNLVWHVDEKGQRQAFTRKWAERHCIDPKCAATMIVDGQSMEPRLQSGDSIVVDYCQRDRIVDGKVYAIAVNDELLVKRLFKEIDGSIRIVSDNPDKVLWPDKLVPKDKLEYLQIIGRVVAVSGGV